MNTLALTFCLSLFLIFIGVGFARLSLYYTRPNPEHEQSSPSYIRALFEDPIGTGEKTKPPATWYVDFWQGASTEMIGAVITSVLLTVLVGIVQQGNEREQLRRELIRNIGSSDNGFALQAVEQLREEGWLSDGTLRNVDLRAANLRNADLNGANLEQVDLRFADLRGANLFQANLRGADLRYTLMQEINTRDIFDIDDARQALRLRLLDFESLIEAPFNFSGVAMLQAWAYSTRANLAEADMRFADASGSDFSFSNMNGANLLGANFSGTNLFMVDMTGAIVKEELSDIFTDPDAVSRVGSPPILNRQTLLPNGHRWFDNIVLTRYADSAAPDYTSIVPCLTFIQAPEETNPPITCGMISYPIPHPPRQPGPFRE